MAVKLILHNGYLQWKSAYRVSAAQTALSSACIKEKLNNYGSSQHSCRKLWKQCLEGMQGLLRQHSHTFRPLPSISAPPGLRIIHFPPAVPVQLMSGCRAPRAWAPGRRGSRWGLGGEWATRHPNSRPVPNGPALPGPARPPPGCPRAAPLPSCISPSSTGACGCLPPWGWGWRDCSGTMDGTGRGALGVGGAAYVCPHHARGLTGPARWACYGKGRSPTSNPYHRFIGQVWFAAKAPSSQWCMNGATKEGKCPWKSIS